MAKRKKVDLVQIIRDNPGCVARIDNDSWELLRGRKVPKRAETWSVDEEDAWWAEETLASSNDDLLPMKAGKGYGSGCCYGGDILVALAQIAGIKVESV